MKKNLLVLVVISIFVSPVMADKPEWAGKGKPTAEQKAAHKTAMEAKEDLDENDDRIKEKSSKLKGVDKQNPKRSEQVQNEFDKGSDKGKESRENNSKKWWKFWGE